MPKKKIEPEIPRLPVKIIRQDDKIVITIQNYSIKLLPLPGETQKYDFITLEQFITNTAKIVYGKIVEREQLKKDLASLNDKPLTPGKQTSGKTKVDRQAS